jgi:co-chaperonin GroES (HSP10)
MDDTSRIKPTRNQVMIEYIRGEEKSKGGIALLCRQGEYARATVLARGPLAAVGIEPGIVTWVHGGKSGQKVDKDIHIVDDTICVAIEEKE